MYTITATPHHIANLRKQVEVDRRDRKNATWRPAFVFLPAADDYFADGETYAPIGAYVQFYVENGEPQVEAVHDVLLINDHIQRRGGHFNLRWAGPAAKRAFDVMLAEWRVEMAEAALEDAKGDWADAIAEGPEGGAAISHRSIQARAFYKKCEDALDAARAELARLQAEATPPVSPDELANERALMADELANERALMADEAMKRVDAAKWALAAAEIELARLQADPIGDSHDNEDGLPY